MSPPINARWFRRPLVAAALFATGILAAGSAATPAKAQYYPYYPYYQYYSGYCNPYYYPYGCPGYAYPSYSYAYPYYGYAPVALGFGFGGFHHRRFFDRDDFFRGGFHHGGFRGGFRGGMGGGGHHR